MLGLGPGEILLIVLVIIIVVGPDRLPQFLRNAGRIYGQLRRAADEMRRSLVLEADRQDAEQRYQEMKRRREEQLEKTPEVLSQGAVAQKSTLLPNLSEEQAEKVLDEVDTAREERHGPEGGEQVD